MRIKFESTGNLEKVQSLLNKYMDLDGTRYLQRAGNKCVEALSEASPVVTGEFASGWSCEVTKESGNTVANITNNSHPEYHDLPFALENGHGTGTGGYVPGRHFISSTMDRMDGEVVKEMEGVISDV